MYFDLTQYISNIYERADAHMYLSKHSESEYCLSSISVSETDQKLAQTLLAYMCERATIAGFVIYYELNTGLINADKNRHILNKLDFKQEEDIDDTELWVKQLS